MLDRDARNLNLATENVNGTINLVGVDDRRSGALSLDRDIAVDIEVARRVIIFVGSRNRERVGATGNDDGIGVGLRIGGFNGRSQRDLPCGILSGLQIDSHGVECGVDLESREHNPVFESLQERVH